MVQLIRTPYTRLKTKNRREMLSYLNFVSIDDCTVVDDMSSNDSESHYQRMSTSCVITYTDR